MGAGRQIVKFAAIGIQTVVRRAFNKEDGERFMMQSLTAMPGAPAKIGQLLGMRAASEIPSPPAMSLEDVKAIIARECPALNDHIEDISEWSKTASIGQTHQCRLKSGQQVAIKIQYPGVAQALAEQIDAVFGLAAFSPAKRYEFDAGATRLFLRERMLLETDYRLEAEAQKRFFARYQNSFAVVARVYPEFTTEKVLTQSWEDSIPLYKAKEELSYGQICKAAVSLTGFVLDSIFGLGCVHADLNPGNFGFRIDGSEVKAVIYDFGSTYQLSAETGVVLYRWIKATASQDSGGVLKCMIDLGFDRRRLNHIEARLLPLSQVVLAPFLEQGLWSAASWNMQEKIDAILGAEKWWFRTAGPPWFLYLMRTVQGWQHAMMVLDASISFENLWWPWKQQLESVARFADARHPAAESVAIGGAADSRPEAPLSAKSLKVLVLEGNEEIVDLTLPSRAVEDLEELVPAGVAEACAKQGLILKEISKKALESGGHPQQLFAASHGKRIYKVWLE